MLAASFSRFAILFFARPDFPPTSLLPRPERLIRCPASTVFMARLPPRAAYSAVRASGRRLHWNLWTAASR
jgi:hypothetical protein